MKRLFEYIISRRNLYIARVSDFVCILVAWMLANWFQYNLTFVFTYAWLSLLIVLIPGQLFCFWLMGLYRGVWRFASLPDLLRIFKAVMLGLLGLFIVLAFTSKYVVLPYAVPLLYAIFLVGLLSGTRLAYRFVKTYIPLTSSARRVLIVGAGSAGEGLVRDLLRHAVKVYWPVAFLDDNLIKRGREIHGIRVVGKTDDLVKVVRDYQIQHIFIAIPSISSANMRRLVNLCEKVDLPYSTLPSLKELTSSQVKIANLRQVSLEDLIGREEVRIDWQQIERHINQKVIFVTGGGGSIGSELCRQIAKFAPKKLIILDHSEYNLYQLELSFHKLNVSLDYQLCLGSILDEALVERLFLQYQPELVFHAAAYKHVPMLEKQVNVAVENNVVGTEIIAMAAIKYKVSQFILISTDKAVNPSNIMGMSKRVAEIYCQNMNQQQAHTKFITVRFGNVMNSAGSVIPLFRSQIEEGGPVTITHPDITRYFMTIPEASRLILQAASIGIGGEIFVLDMGEPIKIQYLAEQLIILSGREVGVDIQITYTGLRPGEKLYEELFYQDEALAQTSHPKIMKAASRNYDWQYLLTRFVALHQEIDLGREDLVVATLKSMVPEYVG